VKYPNPPKVILQAMLADTKPVVHRRQRKMNMFGGSKMAPRARHGKQVKNAGSPDMLANANFHGSRSRPIAQTGFQLCGELDRHLS
jgi:hypothetical protein